MNSSDRILENRRWHFRQIIRSSGGNNAVAALMGVSTSYIVILAGPTQTRNIGDKTAAKIEACFGLEPGALDKDPPSESQTHPDPYIAEIVATLTHVGGTDKEFVLGVSQWVASRALSPTAPRPGKISLDAIADRLDSENKATEKTISQGHTVKSPARAGNKLKG